jgi:hypothetical protein
MRRRPGGGAEERRPTGRTGDEEVAPWQGGIAVLASVSPSRGDTVAVFGLRVGWEREAEALREKGGEQETGIGHYGRLVVSLATSIANHV